MKAALYTGWAFPDDALLPLAREAGLTPAPPAEAELRVGWSLGGLRALRDAMHGGAAPAGIVLLSSGARFCSDGCGWPGTSPAALRALQQKLRVRPDEALRGFHRLTAGEDAPDTLVDTRSRANTAEDLHAGLRELAALDVRADAPRLTMPVLVLHGACDRVFSLDAARATAQLLLRATLRIHPEAGHDLPLMHTVWCAEQIRTWMKAIA